MKKQSILGEAELKYACCDTLWPPEGSVHKLPNNCFYILLHAGTRENEQMPYEFSLSVVTHCDHRRAMITSVNCNFKNY